MRLELVLGQLGQVALAGQEPADPTVRVLDRTFLPGAVRIAEIGFGADAGRKQGVGGELGAAVEGDGPAASLRQPLPGLADPPDQGVGLAVRVRQQDGVAGLALDHAGQVGLAVLAAEDQQIRLPVAEGLAILDLGRPVLDDAVGGDGRGARLAAVAWLAPATCLGQMAVEPGVSAFGTVDIAVDRLVADAVVARAFLLQPSGDLLGRPAALEPGDDVAAQDIVSAQLALPLAALGRDLGRSAGSSRHTPAGRGSGCG